MRQTSVMKDFPASRREPFLDEASYRWARTDLSEVGIPEYTETRDAADTAPEDRGSMRWHLARSRLTLAILLFSGGETLPKVKEALRAAVIAFEDHLDGEHPVLDEFDLAIQSSYVQALWLLSLAKLLGEPSEEIERIANFFAADESNDGADELFELILAKLGRKSFKTEGLIHEDPYQLLLDCVKAEPEHRPTLMTQFLKRWYKGQKECDWWGLHINRAKTPVLKTGFFGYWAFEAAMVTFLWDIDDSSFRDLQHYPKDLADYARQLALQGDGASLPFRVVGGQPCPRTGQWFTPARLDSRRHFTQGETMPKVGGDYGATIWQWDEQQ
jgi:Domain of unknown function (DUF1911)/Domain of unknown function (DUF1910)